MISILKMITGYCKVRISGTGKERFLNLCKNKQILIWDLKVSEKDYSFFVSYKAHKLLHEIGEKTNTKVKIEGKYGLPFFLYRNKKRKMFYTGIILCVFLIYGCSFFIWDIQIKGTEKYTKDEIQTYLRGTGIETGILKRKVDCPSLEEKIREHFEDTAWVSCDIEGTLLTVHVKESINSSDMEQRDDQVPNDIVASKDGIIESIITRNGTPLVKKGTEIKKGDTLISGIIYYYNDYDELLETSKISADGDVKARTVYRYEEQFPLSYYEKEYTGNVSRKFSLCIGNFHFPAVGKEASYEQYDIITEICHLKIGKSFYFPISVHVKKYLEYKPYQVTLSEDEAKEKANKKVAYYLNELHKEGKELQNKSFQTEIKEGDCIITGKAEVIESIGKIRNIP